MITKAGTKFKSEKVSESNSNSNDNNSDNTSDEEESVFETHNSRDNSEINCQLPGCNLSVDHHPSWLIFWIAFKFFLWNNQVYYNINL